MSVVIISYNSSKYIIEALDSVYTQDYQNIELIIADDGSKDNTVLLIKQWLEKHRNRFTDVKERFAVKNQGTSYNLNAGFELCKGEWIKILAGDDVLSKSCVSDNVRYVIDTDCNSVVFSKLLFFKNENGKRKERELGKEEREFCIKLAQKSPKQQYNTLLKRDIMVTVSMFINREMLFRIGKCDVQIPLIEDWPLRLKITKQGYAIYFMDKVTVLHRMEDSVTRKEGNFYHERHLENVRRLKKIYCYPNIPKNKILYYYQEILQYMCENIIIRWLKNKKSFGTAMVYNIFFLLMPKNWNKILFKIRVKM